MSSGKGKKGATTGAAAQQGGSKGAAAGGKGVEHAANSAKGKNAGNAKEQPAPAGGKGGRNQQQQQQQQAQQQNAKGGKGGGGAQQGVTAASAKLATEIASKYPRLDLDKENKQLASHTELIDAAFAELDVLRKRIDVLQEERKDLLDKNRESADNKHDANAIMEKAKQDRDAIRKTFEQLKAARKRRLEEVNKAKANLPVNINLKDSKKLVALNMEQLDKEEKAIEHKMKSVASTGQDRANSKELQAIAQKRRVVREWAKMAAEAEAPVDPAITASLKEANELVQKLIEEGRESRKDVDLFKGALAKNSEELKAARTERKAISDKIEQLKKERDAVYASIRDKKKEHQEKVKQIQKEERDKKAQAEKEKRDKIKKEKLQRQIQELSDAYKDELALCDRLTSFLVNRQSKQKKADTKGSEGEAKEQESTSEEKAEETTEEEDKKQSTEAAQSEETKEEGEEGESDSALVKTKGLQFSMAIHIDFELISVRPPASLEDIPATIESIARKKAVYQRLADIKAEQRQKLEAQLKNPQSDDSPAPKKQGGKKQATENGAPKKQTKKEQAEAAAAPSGDSNEEKGEDQSAEAPAPEAEAEAGDE